MCISVHLKHIWQFTKGFVELCHWGGFVLMCKDVIVNILGCFGNMLLDVEETAAQCCRKSDLFKVILA